MPDKSHSLEIKFWGVRGSTPTPVRENLGFGGNTTCMEIGSGNGERIIIDAGSGIRALGRKLVEEKQPLDLTIFLTHFHWDHIQGIPFFAPLMMAGNKVRFHSFPAAEESERRLHIQMADPYFTLDFDEVGCKREFHRMDGVFHKADLSVTCFPLHHPQGAFGYRIECGGKSIVIATDLEHGDARLDKTLRDYCEGADVMIYDAQYTPDEYAIRQGWGHSTFEAAAGVANDAKVKQLVLFHHDPTHDDASVEEIVRRTTPLFENTIAARELQTIKI